MARLEDRHVENGVLMPVHELRGRTVWTESGDRLGTLRGVSTDDDGRITMLDVQRRWMLGPHHEVAADGMRLEGGDVVVPTAAADHLQLGRRTRHSDQVERSEGSAQASPVLVAGRDGARGRFGGIDVLASLVGAFVAIAALVITGGLLAAVLGTEPAAFDTGMASVSELTAPVLVGALALFVAFFIGGWATGRMARFSGATNGVLMVVWALAMVVGFAALGGWLGEQYNVLGAIELPTLQTDQFAVLGVIALAITLGLMLLGSVLGSVVGERWHRRADRAMLDVVPVATASHGHELPHDHHDRDHYDHGRAREHDHTTVMSADSDHRRTTE